MNYRPLGRSGLLVSPLCFGGNVFGWTADERTSFSLLDAWLDAGFNFVDTADVYSRWVPGHTGGESETVIGNWIRQGGRRDKLVLATKCGNDKGLAPDWIREAVENSLRRLDIDCIDLYQAHRDDPNTPLEATLEAFGKLVEQGKVRAIGASNYTAPRLAQALEISKRAGLPRFESLQPEFNLYDRAGFEGELQALCRREEIGVINYYALAAGFLSGKYRSAQDAHKSPRGANVVKKYVNDRGMKILAALDEVAQRTASTPAQVALAWTMRQPGITSPIASATSLSQLQDLVKAAQLQLDDAAMQRIDAASA
ncbi:MAG TPA: aldo/keto reductase [Ramlibacter sp.]|jgi:aryl-alcohol dehydrogenase-like predicted oxidoreductase|nr:aldo/keto reductase [Ramlibacter sp.]